MTVAVWAVLEHRDGKPRRSSMETLAAAAALAAQVGGEVYGVVLAEDPSPVASELSRHGLAGILAAAHPRLGEYTPGTYVGALESLIRDRGPAFVLFPHSYQTVDHVPRLAQVLGAALVPEVTGFEGEDGEIHWRRPILGGKLQAVLRVKGGEGPVVVTVQSGAYSAANVPTGGCGVESIELDAAGIEPDREILGVEEVAGDQVDLSQAPIVVGVGRGVGGADRLETVKELARELGAEIGASRPVIDSGWLPRDRQIGSSGQTVAPRLYLALGISGAIQHLVGMKSSQVVVAVNKDAGAPIFKIARYGIVGDLHEVVPAITAALREAARDS